MSAEVKQPQEMPKTIWKQAWFWRGALFLILLAGFVIYYMRNPGKLPDWNSVRWNFFIWIIVLSALSNLIAGCAYFLVVKRALHDLHIFTVIRAFIISRSLNLITPQGGTVFRAITLKEKASFSYSQYSATLSACVWLDLCLAAPMALVALCFVPDSRERNQIMVFFLLCWGVLLVSAWLLALWNRLNFIRRIPFLRDDIRTRLSDISELIDSLIKCPRMIIGYGILVMFGNILNGFRFWLCFGMVDAWISWPQAFATGIVVKACNMFSVTPGNLGVIEGIVGLMGELFGSTLGAAVIAGFAYRFASYIALFVMSAIFVFKYE